MELIKYPNSVLFKKNEEVEINDELRSWCTEVESYMNNLPSELGRPMGMAAPQLGRNIRAFVTVEDGGYNWYINPTITWTPSAGQNQFEEGCYSLEAGKFDYKVWRHYAVRIKYQNLAGEWQEKRVNGLKAQVIQHEYDHLEGKLCNDGTVK